MHKRKEGQPHKGWKDSARHRLRSTTSLTCLPAHSAGKPGLCECEACCPVTNQIDAAERFEDADAKAFLDALPRAQWAYADALLRIRSDWPKERAVAFAKAWLRDTITA